MNENLTFTNNEYKLIEKCIDERLAKLSTWIGNNQFAEKEYIELSALKAKFAAVLYIEDLKLRNKDNQSNTTKVTNVTGNNIETPYTLPISVVANHVDELEPKLDYIESTGNPDAVLYGETSSSNKVEVNGETKTITESIKVK